MAFLDSEQPAIPNNRRLVWIGGPVLLLAAIASPLLFLPSQNADTAFVPTVSVPAFTGPTRPRVMIDEGHMNVHTKDGRYSPFARLLEMDGLQVDGTSAAITASLLGACEMYVTANPMGMKGTMQHVANLLRLDRSVHFTVDAFTDDEIQSLVAWVQSGGRVLIVADHAPAGQAARRLAAAFGVEMTTWWAEEEGSGTVTFSRTAGTIRPHPIAEGRRTAEQINTVMTFTGQALRPPREDQIVLSFSNSAREYPFRRSREAEGRSAAGLAQLVALPFGSGRVVVLGEAAAITAQLIGDGDAVASVGMNRADIDNQQFALNIVHWLMGVLN